MINDDDLLMADLHCWWKLLYWAVSYTLWRRGKIIEDNWPFNHDLGSASCVHCSLANSFKRQIISRPLDNQTFVSKFNVSENICYFKSIHPFIYVKTTHLHKTWWLFRFCQCICLALDTLRWPTLVWIELSASTQTPTTTCLKRKEMLSPCK